jgi:hypothetical protein
MMFPSLAFSARYDGDGRRLAFQIRPSVKQVMREAFKRDTAQRRAAIEFEVIGVRRVGA